jgi:7-cyano-7-deazaguanine synthase
MGCRETLRARMAGLRAAWGQRLGPDHLIDLAALGQVSDTALTGTRAIALAEDGLPNTFVPGRNLLFFTFAAALAYRRGLRHLVGGMCETDYSGYPDCRDDTLKSLQVTLNLGMEARFVVEAPLMRLTKAQSWALARDLGGDELVEIIRTETHSCYLGERGRSHDWGKGCGTCPACELRARGWREYAEGGIPDPAGQG